MLASAITLAISLLVTLAGIVAALAIADSFMKAHRAYAQLMREAALMQAGYAVEVAVPELRMRRAPVRVTPLRRSPALRMQAVPVFAVA